MWFSVAHPRGLSYLEEEKTTPRSPLLDFTVCLLDHHPQEPSVSLDGYHRQLHLLTTLPERLPAMIQLGHKVNSETPERIDNSLGPSHLGPSQ